MLQSKRANLILSFLLAVTLWFYVVGELNPTVTKQFSSIPITITNQKSLAEDGLAISSVSDKTINVTLSGKRSVLSGLKSSDITATVDVSEAAKGSNQLKIELRVPNNVEIAEQNLNRVTVRVESRVGETKPVKVQYTGKKQDGMEPTTVSISPASITVFGVETQVQKVAYVQANVKYDNVREDASEVSSNLTAMDKSGKTVENVTLSQKTAKIESVMYYTKGVALTVPIKGQNDELYQRTVDVPEKVLLKGSKADLDMVSAVTTDTLDLSKVTESTRLPLQLRMSNKLMLADSSQELFAKVTVKSLLSSKTVTLNNGNITIQNLDKGLTGTIATNGVTVTCQGTEKALEKIDASHITATVNAKDLKAGNHTVAVNVTCKLSGVKVSVSPAKVTLDIDEENTEEE